MPRINILTEKEWRDAVNRMGGDLRTVLTFDFTGKIVGGNWYGWKKRGRWHRVLGPAAIYTNGEKFWWYEGRKFEKLEYWEFMYSKYKGTKYEALCLANLLTQ